MIAFRGDEKRGGRFPITLPNVLLAIATAAVTLGAVETRAASYTWNGGNGTWSTAATNWTNASGTPWTSSSGTANLATFNTASLAVTVGEPITANGIAFLQGGVALSGGTVSLGVNAGTTPVITATTSVSGTIGSVLAGSVGLTKSGSGMLVLTGSNTYTGTTAVASGTLQLSGGPNRIAAGGTLSFTGSNTTLDVTTSSQAFSAMTFLQPTTGTAAMTVSGAGGSVTVSGTANFEVGPGGAIASSGLADSLSMVNLSSFAYTNTTGTFRVGLKAGTTNTAAAGTSSLVLAQNTAVTAAVIGVADISASNDGGKAQLLLGQTNTFNVTNITQANGRSDSYLQFQAGLTNPSIMIRGTNGTGPMSTWLVGNNSQTGSVSKLNFVSTTDLSAGTVDALINSLIIGQANCSGVARAGTQRSSFTMGSGTLAAGTITVGKISGGSATNGISGTFAASGVMTISKPGSVVSATNFYVAENTYSGTGSFPSAVTGTVNLSAGTLLSTNLARGSQTGIATASTAFNWTGGTIGNIDGANLTVDTLPLSLTSGTGTFLASNGGTITVNAGSPISGAGTLVKTGPGRLILQAANTYTGPTTVSAGTVALGSSGAIASSSTVSLSTGAVFDASAVSGGYSIPGSQLLVGAGSVAGGLTIGGSSAVIPAAGTGPLSVTGGLTLAANGSYDWQMLDAAGAAGTGWGLLSADTVTFSGLSPSSPFRVNLWSQSAVGTNGAVPNFDPSVAGTWRILTSASTISGFSASNFSLATAATGASNGFTNPLLGGTFSLALSGDSLGIDLKFTPYVPYTWYADGTSAGGSGTWSAAGVTWNDGSSMVAWDPVKGALFGTVGGTVTVNGPQSVGYGLSFTADGYTLAGDALTFTGNQTANTVTVNGGLTATIATTVTATGGMVKSGVGTLVLAGDTAAGGGVSLQLGTLAVGAGGAAGTLAGDVVTAAGTTLVFNRSNASTYAGAISGAGGIRKAGAGAVTLSGSCSYTGGTVLAAGTIALGSANALGSSGTISFVGGGLQYSAANTADYSARISSGTGQAFAIDTNGQTVSYATGLAGEGNTLTKLGDGTLSLSGTGSFTGATRIVGGTLALASTGAIAGSTLDMNAADAGTLLLSLTGSTYAVGGLQGSRNIDLATNTVAVGGNGQSTTYGGVISGAGGLTKTGTGTMVLSATQAYLGTTGVTGGTLRVSQPNQMASTGTLSLGGSDAVFDIGATTQTLATLTTGNGGAFTNMAVTGSGGSLVLAGPGNFEVGPGGTVTAGQRAVVSLAGIASLSYTVPDGMFRVGLKGGSSQSGAPGVSSLTLAATNTIVSGTLGLGDLGGSSDGGTAQLFLGQVNTIRTGYVSMSPSRADSLMQFAGGLASPTLVVRGTDGSSPAGTWLVGSLGQFSTASKTSFTSTVDLSAGTTDAAATWLVVGQAFASSSGRGGTMRSSFTMGAGTLTTGSITVGRISSSGASAGVGGAFTAVGLLSIADPAALVTATSIYVSENTFSGTGSATKTVSGTISLSNGTLRAGTLARGAQTGLANVVNTTFLWTGGTIGNLPGGDLTIDTLPLTLSTGTGTFLADAGRTITLNAASPMSGAGGLVKAGAGTLLLLGTHGYTGPTTVTAGSLLVSGSLGTTAVTVATGGLLGGSGSILGAVSVADGTLSPGPGVAALALGALSLDATSSTLMQITGTAPASQYDQVLIAGSLAYGGTLSLDLAQTFADNTSFNLFSTFSTFAGNLSSITSSGAAYNGLTFTRVGDVWTSTESGGQALRFDQATGILTVMVPEPTAPLIAGLGIAALFEFVRRRRA